MRQKPSSWFPRSFYRAGTLLLGTLIGISIAEGAFSLLKIPRFYEAHSSPPQFAPIQFVDGAGVQRWTYVNVPSEEIEFIYDGNPRGYFGPENNVIHRTNAQGFRGPEFPQKRDPETFRLVFLGDSLTFGEGVHFSDTYPEQIRRRLAKIAPGRKVECLNLGVGGHNTAQALELLHLYALALEPDAIVLCYSLNDAEPPLFEFDPAAGGLRRAQRELEVFEGLPTPTLPKRFPYNFRSAQLLGMRVLAHRSKQQTIDYYRRLYRDSAPGWREVQGALASIAQICRERRLPCYVALFPTLIALERYPFSQEHARVKRLVEQNGLKAVDLLPSFEQQRAESLWVHPTDQHPNEVAHRIAADLLAEALQQTL